jgi:hypothetical protein
MWPAKALQKFMGQILDFPELREEMALREGDF